MITHGQLTSGLRRHDEGGVARLVLGNAHTSAPYRWRPEAA